MRTLVATLVLMLCVIGLAPAQQPNVVESTPEALDVPETKVPAHYSAVLELIEAEKRDVAELTAQLERATDIRETMRLEKAIGQRRERLQIEILELRHAQALAANKVELAASIQASIEQLKNPALPPAKSSTDVRERARQD